MFCLFVAIFVFEMLGVCSSHFVTITAIIREFIPLGWRFVIIGWLCYHFLIVSLVQQCRVPLKQGSATCPPAMWTARSYLSS
jgi:hypothetical protein